MIILVIWVWINTYENTIFRGIFTSINPSYFDVNYRGTIGFDTLPYYNLYSEYNSPKNNPHASHILPYPQHRLDPFFREIQVPSGPTRRSPGGAVSGLGFQHATQPLSHPGGGGHHWKGWNMLN